MRTPFRDPLAAHRRRRAAAPAWGLALLAWLGCAGCGAGPDAPQRAKPDPAVDGCAPYDYYTEGDVPAVTSAQWMGGLVEDVAVVDDVAVLASYTCGLRVVDVADPFHPRLLAATPSKLAVDVAMQGHLVAVAEGSRGFALYDLADPTEPRRLCEVPVTGAGVTSAYTDAVALAGNHLFVAGFHRQLVSFDIRDPRHPVERDRLTMERPGDLVVVGDRLFVGAVRVFRIEEDGKLTYLQELAQGPAEDLLSVGNRLHAATASGVATFDLADPDTVCYLNTVPVGSVRCLVESGDLVFAGLTPPALRLKVLDYSDPTDPRPVADTPADGFYTFYSLARVGDVLLAGDRWLRTIDIHDPAHPVFAPHPDEPAYPQGLAVCGGRSVVVDGHQASVYRLGTAVTRQPEATWSFTASLIHLTANTRRIYMVRDLPGLIVLDPTTGNPPLTVQGGLRFGPLAAADSLLVTGDGGKLRVFTLDDPDNPTAAGVLTFGDVVGRMALSGARVLLSLDQTELVLVDVSDPTAPVEVARDPGDASYGTIAAVAWTDSVGFAYNGNGVLRSVRVGDDGVLETVGIAAVLDQGQDLAVRGGIAYVLGGGSWGGPSYLAAVDVRDPRHPVLLGRAVEPDLSLVTLEPADGYLYVLSMGGLRRYWPDCNEAP